MGAHVRYQLLQRSVSSSPMLRLHFTFVHRLRQKDPIIKFGEAAIARASWCQFFFVPFLLRTSSALLGTSSWTCGFTRTANVGAFSNFKQTFPSTGNPGGPPTFYHRQSVSQSTAAVLARNKRGSIPECTICSIPKMINRTILLGDCQLKQEGKKEIGPKSGQEHKYG